MEILIGLVVIAVVVVVALRLRKTFSPEVNRAKRIRRAHRDGQ